jgi:hypothetical protein
MQEPEAKALRFVSRMGLLEVDMNFLGNHTGSPGGSQTHTGTSAVESFEIGDRSIKVRFTQGGTYLYDQTKPGRLHVAQMIALARAGAGLATYINQQVRGNYARKID